MAVNLPIMKDVLAVPGFRVAAASGEVRYQGRDDVALIELAPGSTVAGIFTQNSFRAAPVSVAQEHMTRGEVRYLLINSGNANAATGEAGIEAARKCCAGLAEIAGVEAAHVLPFSTGVIGEPLPSERVISASAQAYARLADAGWEQAAAAIMTTDTVPKAVSRRADVDGQPIVVTGMAKGVGMVRPDMATVLAYIATDATVAQADLGSMLGRVAARSFNRITVDGDTSTNDSCILMASGVRQVPRTPAGTEALEAAITDVASQLAQWLIRDGEGATRFVTIEVSEGRDADECLEVAYTIAHSPLVKTALFAGDPNWGRFVMAIGRAGVEDLDVRGVSIFLDQVQVVAQGALARGYREQDGARVMGQPDVSIRVVLGRGAACETVWTSDLSYEYVKINAEYRT
ncbi:MAG: bifunctional glutamate N-acetyltransferase/amino-acid acetyltransferase ArgJ [Pseudomonadales bacterium]